jgi:hypothetical protein
VTEFVPDDRTDRTIVCRGVTLGEERMDPAERTLAEVLRDAGHATGCFGKWHNGTQWPYHPLARGFDTFYGFTEGHWGDYFDPPLEHDGRFVRGRGYIADDIAALQTLGDSAPDLLIGGPEHDRKQETINGRAILKADADARSAWRIDLYVTPGASGTGGPGAIRMVPRLEDLGAGAPADPIVQAAVDAEWTSFGAAFCADPARALPPGCLADAVGRAGVTLEAEELKIRRFETNFGDWVTDIARSAWPQAQIAFLNSGSLRLNYDLPPGPISRKAIETMFAYPTPLRLVRLSGAVLDQALSRTVEAWTGNGHWLQISGFALGWILLKASSVTPKSFIWEPGVMNGLSLGME